jgi:hypothetical protein
MGMHLGNLARLSAAQTRSISPENFSGAKGQGGMAAEGTGAYAARDLGQTWKISPSIRIAPGECRTLAAIDGEGAIQQIWMTPTGRWRNSILRVYWDGAEQPSVECPVGDFFACGWQKYSQISSLAVCVNPGSGLNCYWEMPFRKGTRITMTNQGDEEMTLYYQINYVLRLRPRPVSAHPPAALYTGLHHPGRRARARTLCGHLYGLGREQQRLVGGRRGQILSGWG